MVASHPREPALTLIEFFQSLPFPVQAVVAVLGFLLIARAAWRVFFGPRRYKPRYRARESVLTPMEARFYRSLAPHLPDHVLVLVKPRLVDVLEPYGRHRFVLFSKVSQKHVDFLICSEASAAPLVAIEVDDRSHERPDRIARDKFVDAAFKSAGLPLVRVPAKRAFKHADMKLVLAELG